MTTSRRSFLKGFAGIAGISLPFAVGHRLGRQEAEGPTDRVSKAASRGSLRLSSGNVDSLRWRGAPDTQTGEDGTEASSCVEEIERTTVSSDSVEAALREQGTTRPFEWYRYRLDEELKATDRQTTAELLACDRTDWNDYTDDFYDCEEFAMSLRMNFIDRWDLNNVGIVYDESATPIPHVYNIVFYDDGTFDLVEPQTDAIVSPEDDERYTFKDVAILL